MTSTADLIALEYQGQPTPAPSGLSVSGLAALTYAAELSGIKGSQYADAYAQHGKDFLWWKAYRAEDVLGAIGTNGETATADGLLLLPQDTTGFKFMGYSTRRDIVSEEYGLIEKGATGFSTLPSQAIIARHDRISFKNMIAVGRQIVQRDSTTSNAIDRGQIQKITAIIKLSGAGNSTVVPTDEYTIGSDAHSITWVSNTTTTDGDYCSIEYQYLPMWEWLEDGDKGIVQQGVDGAYLPQRGVLIMRQPE